MTVDVRPDGCGPFDPDVPETSVAAGEARYLTPRKLHSPKAGALQTKHARFDDGWHDLHSEARASCRRCAAPAATSWPGLPASRLPYTVSANVLDPPSSSATVWQGAAASGSRARTRFRVLAALHLLGFSPEGCSA